MGKVTMFNPQSQVTQEASQDAFDRLYSKEGWVRVADAPVVDDELEALRSEAIELGVEWKGNWGRPKLTDEIAKAKAAAEAAKGGGQGGSE